MQSNCNAIAGNGNSGNIIQTRNYLSMALRCINYDANAMAWPTTSDELLELVAQIKCC